MLSHPTYGIQGERAPAWGVTSWFNLPDDKPRLDIQDFEDQVVYLYCFQSWCPGCHARGFPALLQVMEAFTDTPDVAFVAVQTVFEGFSSNTLARAQEVARQYHLTIPFGHDPGPDGRRSLILQRYRTGGTPWTVIIDRAGVVRYNDFFIAPDEAVALIESLKNGSI